VGKKGRPKKTEKKKRGVSAGWERRTKVRQNPKPKKNNTKTYRQGEMQKNQSTLTGESRVSTAPVKPEKVGKNQAPEGNPAEKKTQGYLVGTEELVGCRKGTQNGG